MKRFDARKLWAALALALALCLAAPAALPTAFAPFSVAQAAAKKVKLSKTKASVCVGGTLQLKLQNAKGKVSWKSSNKKVAAVDGKGKITGKKTGTATITATNGKKSYKCKLTVKSGLSIGDLNVTLTAGDSRVLTVNQLVGGKVTVKSDDDNVAGAGWKGDSKKGKKTLTIRGKGQGSATITLKNASTKETVRIRVTVTAPAPPNQYFVLDDPNDSVIDVYYNPMAMLHPPFKVGVYLHTDKAREVQYRIADESIVSCEWDDDWDYYAKDMTVLYVYPKRAGTTTITLSNSANTETITIRATVVIDNSFYVY